MTTRIQRIGVSVIFSSALCAPFVAGAKLSRVGSSDVTFTALGPAGMKIVGAGTDLQVVDDGPAVKVIVPLATIKTGIGIRDEHMNKYLETPRFPNAELEVPRSALKIPAAGQSGAFDAAGVLRLHGKAKSIGFHCTSSREGNSIKVTGSLRINMPDFGIDVPSYLGVTVKPDVEVTVHLEANDQ